MFSQECPLLIVHGTGKMLEPSHQGFLRSKLAFCRFSEVRCKRDAYRPVKPPLQVARVLDVTKKSIDRHLCPQLFGRYSSDRVGEWLAITNRPARQMPQTPARSSLPKG